MGMSLKTVIILNTMSKFKSTYKTLPSLIYKKWSTIFWDGNNQGLAQASK